MLRRLLALWRHRPGQPGGRTRVIDVRWRERHGGPWRRGYGPYE